MSLIRNKRISSSWSSVDNLLICHIGSCHRRPVEQWALNVPGSVATADSDAERQRDSTGGWHQERWWDPEPLAQYFRSNYQTFNLNLLKGISTRNETRKVSGKIFSSHFRKRKRERQWEIYLVFTSSEYFVDWLSFFRYYQQLISKTM